MALQQIPAAINAFMRAFQTDSKNLETLMYLGDLHVTQKDWPSALVFYAMSINIDPTNTFMNQLYANGMAKCHFKEYSEMQRSAMEVVLSDATIDPRRLLRSWRNVIFNLPSFSDLSKAIVEKKYDLDVLQPHLNSTFFTKGLERLRNNAAMIEVFLRDIRKEFLVRAVDEQDINLNAHGDFLYSLSMQCWTNEHAFFVTDDEKKLLEKLKLDIEGHLSKAQELNEIDPLIYLYACYSSPIDINGLSAQSKKMARRGDDNFKKFVQVQIDDAIEESKIKKTITQLTPIDDSISKMVQDMYEESPYPRGVEPVIIDKHLVDETPQDVLFAGCGTGFQILGFSQQYPNGTFTAVDLSSSSLAYAIRQTKQRLNYSTKKIRFGQADILKLDTLPERYDRIYCTGVLHHMHDPEKGLAALKNILRPNGEMRLALYSEMARQEIVSARDHIAKLGYKETFEDIRRFRHDMIAMLEQDNCPEFVKFIVQIVDFYSLSECRDLVFHVQEHRYDIPQILDILDRHDLEFVSFNIRHKNIKETFVKMFPNESDMTDLMKWHEYEQAHPHTFVEMYDFNVRHKV